MEIPALITILAVGALLRVPFLNFPPDDDLGFYTYPPWFRKRGVRIVKDYYIRFPLPWIYALAFWLFGKNLKSARIFDLFYELATATALYFLCAKTFSSGIGLGSAALYLWFANSASVALFSGNAERYYNIFIFAGFLLLIVGVGTPPDEAAAYFFASGLCFAATVYFKDVLVLNALAGAFAIWLTAPEPASAVLWLAAGFALLAVVVYIPVIHFNGGLKTFFKLSKRGYLRGFQDNPDRGSLKKLFKNSSVFFLESAPLIIIPVLYFLFFSEAFGWGSHGGRALATLVVWLLATAAVFLIQKTFWPYHFIPFVPVLSVLTAVGLERFYAERMFLSGNSELFSWILVSVSFGVALFMHLKSLSAGSDPEKHASRFTRDKMDHLAAVPKIAEYIKSHSSPDDYIYQWGCLYHLYILSDRRWPVWGGVSLGPPVKEWQVETLENIVSGLRANPPKFFVIHLQSIDMRVIEKLTGLIYEPERVFSVSLRIYKLAADRRAQTPAREINIDTVKELLANAEVPFKLGLEAFLNGDNDGARKNFDVALALDPAHLGALFSCAKMAVQEALYDRAEAIYRRLAEWDDYEFRMDGVHELLKLYSKTGNQKGVEEVIRQLKERGVRYDRDCIFTPPIAYLLAGFFMERGDNDRALEIYQELKTLPVTLENRRFYVSRKYHTGRIYFEKRAFQKAISQLEQCLKVEPGHNQAEALLAKAKGAENSFPVKKVLLFACAPLKNINLTLDAVRKDFPGCKIVLAALKKTDPKFADDPRIDEIITFPFNGFSIARLLLSSTRRQVSSATPDVAVIPGTLPNLSHSAVVFINILLYAWFASPKRTYFYRGPYMNRREASLGLFVRVVLRKIYEALFMPFWLVADFFELLRHPGKRGILCLFPDPNDLVAHNVKADWMKQNGINGVEFGSYMGNPYSLYYPPLSLWLLSRVGTVGFVLIQTLLFGAAGVATAFLAGHAWVIIFIPYFLSSLFYRANTIFAGRLDFLSWGFVLASLTAFHYGHPLIAALFYSASVMGHTTVATLGGMGLLILAVSSGKLFPEFAVMVPVTAVLTFSWWLPFLKNRGKFAFHRVWGEITFSKTNYLSYNVPFRNLTLFLIAAFLTGGLVPSQALVLTPWFVYLLGILRKRYIFHTTCMSGAILTLGAFALFLNPSPALIVLFMILINATDPQDNPRIVPLFEEPFLSGARKLFHPVQKYGRVALECRKEEFWDDNLCWGWLFNVAANRFGFHLMAGVGFDQVDPVLPLEYELKINVATAPEELVKILKTTGSGYVACYTPEFAAKLEIAGFAKLGEEEFPPYGYIGGRRWSLYRVPFPADIIEPAVEWSYVKNGIRFRPSGENTYRIKLACYPGWKAVQNGRNLPVRDLSPGMEIKVNGSDDVALNFRPGLFDG